MTMTDVPFYTSADLVHYIILIGLSLVCLQLSIIIYRVYFHPLSTFPGPKIAATSRWYGLHYDLFREDIYGKIIKDMHKKYGPIVRIGPDELHIQDEEYYDTLFNFNPELSKTAFPFVNMQHTESHDLHKHRRRPFESFFSRASVTKLEWLLDDKVDKACRFLADAAASQKPLKISNLFRALTFDMICEYAFGEPTSTLDDFGTSQQLIETVTNSFAVVHWLREVSWASWMLLNIPKKLPASMLDGPSTAMFRWHKDVFASMKRPSHIKRQGEFRDVPSIFETFRTADLPPSEKSDTVQFDTALLFVTAGFETTGATLSLATYHILANPSINERLQTELRTAIPDTSKTPTWSELEKLPYLKAVIQESLRMSLGVMHRLSRVNHQSELRYGDWVIPPHTIVAMTPRDLHYSETLFPQPTEFRPERWLQGEESKQLEKWSVPFSRGSRSCLGMQLAYAELYLTLAAVFRKFDMELHDTTRLEVDPYYDRFVPAPKSAKGVWVKVKLAA